MKKFNALIFICLFGLGMQAIAQSITSQIKTRNDLFLNKETINKETVLKFRHEVQSRRHEMYNVLINQELRKGKPQNEAENKTNEEDEILAFDILLSQVDELQALPIGLTEKEQDRAHQIAQRVVSLSFALQIIGPKPAILNVPAWASGVLHEWKIDLKTPITREATNLFDPVRNTYYSHAELLVLQNRGGDISKLNPQPNSGFWRDPGEISKIDIKDRFINARDPLHQGIKVEFPETNIVIFDKVKKTQLNPKIVVKFKGADGKFYKAKLKFGRELHSEITAAALFMALGYSADISRYVRDMKIYFKSEIEITKFKEDWLSYFEGMAPIMPQKHVNEFIKEKGKDRGGDFIIVNECVVEADPEGLLRAGPIDFDTHGINKMREARAYALLNLWIENSDWRPDNANLILRDLKNGQYDFHFVVQDLGCSFGGIICEKLDRFRTHVVKEATDSEITFDFRSPVNQPMKDESTLNDYKWGARLISQLTRKQLEDAVALAGWPNSLQKLLVEKLISRRNEFVKVFGLEREGVPALPVDIEITTDDQSVVKGNLQKTKFEGYGTNFGDYWEALLWNPVINALKAIGKTGLELGTCGLEKLSLEPVWFGWDKGVVVEVLVSICRDVVKNPEPKDDTDIWLVRDIVKLGLRGGFGLVVVGDVSLIKQFTLVYGAGTKQEAKNGYDKILNVLLPLEVQSGNLPNKYVLIREDYIAPRVRIRTDDINWFPIGADLTDTQYFLNRTVVTNRGDNNIIFYQDKSIYNEIATKLFFDLQVTRLSFFKHSKIIAGGMTGAAWSINEKSIGENSVSKQILTEVIRTGDFSKIGSVKGIQEFQINAKILNSTFWGLNFLGFYGVESKERTDFVQVEGPNGEGKQEFFKDTIERKRGWSFFGLSENDLFSVKGYLAKSGAVVSLEVVLSDSDTESAELDNGYHKFLNGLTPGFKNLEFTSSKHSSNDRWGETISNVSLYLYPEATERLINADPIKFVELYADLSKHNKRDVLKAWHEYYSEFARRKTEREVDYIYLPGHLVSGLLQIADMFRLLKKARAISEDPREKLQLLIRALRETIFYDKNSESLDPSLLATVVAWVGEKDIFLRREIGTPYNVQNRFPSGKSLVWQDVGEYRKRDLFKMVLLPEEVLEIWTMFDWL
ncbi:MAG: hypothetical protein SGJ18_16260 [Pseudomonadota bacterium]|nr:hypothetical protein [Pseudomonadota bacterium]